MSSWCYLMIINSWKIPVLVTTRGSFSIKPRRIKDQSYHSSSDRLHAFSSELHAANYFLRCFESHQYWEANVRRRSPMTDHLYLQIVAWIVWFYGGSVLLCVDASMQSYSFAESINGRSSPPGKFHYIIAVTSQLIFFSRGSRMNIFTDKPGENMNIIPIETFWTR